jgi:hypothetical protein
MVQPKILRIIDPRGSFSTKDAFEFHRRSYGLAGSLASSESYD